MIQRFFFALLALHLLTFLAVGAAQRLVVNGVDIAEFTNALEPGVSYVAAEPFARSVGATFRYSSGAQTVNFELAGRFVALPVGSAAGEARLEGQTLYVPVKETARQLGGEVDYLTEAKTVVVVFPRARLLSVQPPEPWDRYERFVLRLSAPVAIEERFELSLNTVRFRFKRTDLASKQSFSGEGFSDAVLLPGESDTDFMLTLDQGSAYEMYTVPKGALTEVVIDIFSLEDAEDAQEVEAESDEARRVIIDSSVPASAAAARLEDALTQRGVAAQRTHEADEVVPLDTRMRAGIGSALYVSLDDAPLDAGQVRLYYLGGDSAGLDAVIRQNAAEVAANMANTEADAPTLPQRVLRDLAPDLAQGELYAQTLGGRLTAAGWRVEVQAVPLYLLSGAAGRGVMLELNSTDLNSDIFIATLADALTSLLE